MDTNKISLAQVQGAVIALENEIYRLEEGKTSVDKLIVEKQEQIKYFLTLIEKAHEEIIISTTTNSLFK